MRSFLLLCVLVPTGAARADSAKDQAAKHNKSGLGLFESGNKEQALIEFQMAEEMDPQSDYLFMVAQCEYHLGRLKAARGHYEQVAKHEKSGELADAARLRIDAIDRRPSTFAINTVPSGVDVVIEADAGRKFSGQAPNNFDVPRGHYRLTVSKPAHTSQTIEIDIGIAETKPLFFQLSPIKARLEIRTHPKGATLYVRGNRTQNPYSQDVDPGNYEMYAEARDYLPRRESVDLSPGEKRSVDFALTYVQRSGRPELIGFWTAMGAVAAGSAVLARLDDPASMAANPASLTLMGAAMAAGGISGALVSTAFVPDYIRDNLALFRIGAMWVGATEGGSLGLAVSHKMSAGWIGGAAGLGAGTIAGTLLDDHAPNYGRVAMIQSGAFMGALAGAMVVPAFNLDNKTHSPLGVLVGLNIGLGAGLGLAYLPDQKVYGPTWNRVILVDLAGAAGAFAGALAGTVDNCIGTTGACDFKSNSRTAQLALVGGGVGLVTGWLLTKGFDKDNQSPSENAGPPPPVALIPVPSALPVLSAGGRMSLVPGLAASGRF